MAIVAHTPYTHIDDVLGTNLYISDGHGTPISRSNRYFNDGHGRYIVCCSHNCPSDPNLATEYMHLLRLNYERLHPSTDGRQKKCVIHEQIYFSPTEDDNVPADELMEMATKLIERTRLREFASIYIPHDNTAQRHCHISICPYSIDATHKLCLNNSFLNELRREADRICVEHGYSIIENPALWADRDYRGWFFQVKEEGIITIHPPREQDMSFFRKEHSRAKSYYRSKQLQAEKQSSIEAEYKRLTQTYTPESAHLFYESFFFNPRNPSSPMYIKRKLKNGEDASQLCLHAASMLAWSLTAAKELKRKHLPGSENLIKRLSAYSGKAFAAMKLLQELDIRTHDELICHITSTGADMNALRQNIKQQNLIIEQMFDIMDAIDKWENQKDDDAYRFLEAHKCCTTEEIEKAKKKYNRAVARKEYSEKLLDDRRNEYRHLKEAEATLTPINSEEPMRDYLLIAFGKEIDKKISFADLDILRSQLYGMGKVVGLSRTDIDILIQKSVETGKRATWIDYNTFMRQAFVWDEFGIISSIYCEISDEYAHIRNLRQTANAIPVIGVITCILNIIICIAADWEIEARLRHIEQLKWEAEIQKFYAKEAQKWRQESLKMAKAEYELSIIDASESEIFASKKRFYSQAARILGRMDIEIEVNNCKDTESLDSMISKAANRARRETASTYTRRKDLQRH